MKYEFLRLASLIDFSKAALLGNPALPSFIQHVSLKTKKMSTSSKSDVEEKLVNLEQDSELRFEVDNKTDIVHLELRSGTAEIFGSELVKGKMYKFVYPAKVAVFTYHGCAIGLKMKNDTSYIAEETPMFTYLNCHCCLEQLRSKAEIENGKGPIAMVVGPQDVGKSSLCKILTNYASRMVNAHRKPIFVDLDIGQGCISIPGSIGAHLIERPAPIQEGFMKAAPLVYHYGFNSINDSPTLYNKVISAMAKQVHKRMEDDPKVRCSGVIVNTLGWIKGKGYQHLTHAAKEFEASVILVLDNERLYNELIRDMPPFVRVVLLPKSGGVVERGPSFRTQARSDRIREYFYGNFLRPLHPHTFDVSFVDLKIYRIGTPALPDSCMPLGKMTDEFALKLVAVQPGSHILHNILALSHATSIEENVVETNIRGFICVTSVDMNRQILTILSPQPKPLPQCICLLSEVQFMDSR